MTEEMPFIEVHIVNLQDKTLNGWKFVLGEIANWYQSLPCKIRLLHDSSSHYIRIEFDKIHEKKFWGNAFLEKLWDKQDMGHIDLSPRFSSPYTQDDQGLYLILRYKTNQKEKLGLDFRYAVHLSKIFGFDISAEPVDDGFILFYKTKDDYLISQIKNRSIKEIIALSKKRGAFSPRNIAFLKKNYRFLQS